MTDPIAGLTPDRLTVVGLLLTFITGLIQGWWVLGREFKKKDAECDMWRDIALRGTSLAERATTVAERASERPS